jgi:hypothetical protein
VSFVRETTTQRSAAIQPPFRKVADMKRILPALVGLALAASLVAGAAGAQPPPRYAPRPPAALAPPRRPNSLGPDWALQQDEARRGVRQHQLVPLGRVIAQIGVRTPGRQLDTGLEYQDGRAIYRVRWMTRDGRRVDYLIDAATGAILGGG